MNDGLIDALRHNAWATREVLAACRDLTESQLDATATGTYGSVIATLRHIVPSEANYYGRLTGERPGWAQPTAPPPTLEEMTRRIDDLAARWDRFLAEPFDAERTFVIPWHDGIDRDVPAGVVLAQALYHGSEHRAHIRTVLTSIGVPTPALGLWDYAEATDRAPRRGA